MEDKKLNRVFDRVKLSREREEAMLADLLCEKKEVSSMKNAGSRRRIIPAAALVAAVLVAVLAGTAVAQMSSGRLEVSPIGGDYENGYNVRGAYQNIPLERLSEELLECAAQTGGGSEELVLGSWSEAEEFIGVEVANNPMLEEMAQSEWEPLHECDATPEDMRRCTVRVSCCLGLPNIIWLHADYFGDYFEEGPFGVNVSAFIPVKTPGHSDRPYTLTNKSGKTISIEDYVTPSGMEVAIFTREGTVRTLDGSSFQQLYYAAYFTINSALFEVDTSFNEENADTSLHLLKQVLDAYE